MSYGNLSYAPSKVVHNVTRLVRHKGKANLACYFDLFNIVTNEQ